MTADPRAQWAELLPVPADAPPDAAVAQFLRALPGTDFVPPIEQVAAVNALAGAALPNGSDETIEQMLRTEVEAFAEHYWNLEPAERSATWAGLSWRGAPAARLRELEPGLNVPTPSLIDPHAVELAALFRALFLMPPRGRAIRRNTWLVENATNMGRWYGALQVVLRDAPGLAALDAQLHAALGRNVDLAALVEGATAASQRRRSSVAVDVADFAARMREYERRPGTSQPKFTDWVDRATTRIGVAVAIVFALLGLAHILKPTDKVPPQPTTRYEREPLRPALPPPRYGDGLRAGPPPDQIPAPAWPAERTAYMTDDQVRACQAYDSMKRGDLPPVYYREWVRAGKPATGGHIRIPGDPPTGRN